MKKILNISILLLLSLNIFTQEYVPLVKDSIVWSEIYKHSVYEPGDYTPYYYGLLNEDTLIEEKNYYKLYSFNDTIYNIENANYWGAIREENKKVYYRGKLDFMGDIDEEILIYDFSVNSGDTIYLGNLFAVNEYMIVSEIDSIQINGNYRKRILFMYDDYIWTEWIEGIGNTKGLLYTSGDIPTDGSNHFLVCYFHNDHLFYHNNEYDNCFPLYTDIKDLNTVDINALQVYPMPITDVSYIDIKNANNKYDKLYIFNSLGKIIKTIQLSNIEKIPIYKKDFIIGMYYFKLTSNNGNVYSGKFIVI